MLGLSYFEKFHLKKSENQGGKDCRKGRGGKNVYPERQGPCWLFIVREPPKPSGVSGRGSGRVIADRAASLKEGFLADKIAGRAADRGKIPPAPGAVFRVPGHFGVAALAEKTWTF